MGDCHYLEGNVYTQRRMEAVRYLLGLAGIGEERLQVRWVSAAEGQVFAGYVSELTEVIRREGPLDRDSLRIPLAAVEGVLRSPRIRWLVGVERRLTEEGNVYGEKPDPDDFREMIRESMGVEYEKALLVEVLKEGPKTVGEMARTTGLPIHTVSLRLNDLERSGEAELEGYDGSTPRFGLLAA